MKPTSVSLTSPRLPAHGFQRLPRQVGVDMRDHPLPIAQQEEPDDRRHHDERHDIEDRQAAGDHPLHEPGKPGHRLGELGAEQIAQFADVLGRQMLLEQEDQLAELVLEGAHEGRHPGDQLDDLALDQRHQDHQDQGEAEHEEGDDEEARQAAADPPALEARHRRSQDIGDREPGGERHQDALDQAERQGDEKEEAEPEQQPVRPRAHNTCAEPVRMRAQRTR